MRRLSYILAVVLLVGFAALGAQAQLIRVGGKVKGNDGKPLVGATVVLQNRETGQKYTMKTDKNGEYFSIGVTPGKYHIVITQDGQQLWESGDRIIQDEREINIDLAQEKTEAQQRAIAQLTPEQRKKIQEQKEAEEKERSQVQNLNQLLAQAKSAEDSGNYDQAVSAIKQAVQADPTRDVLWGRLGQVYLTSAAAKKSDPTAAIADYTEAADAYKRAIALKPSEAGYHNNLGQALAKMGKTEDAIAEYNTAAQLDPANAGLYYFNLGAILTNANKADEANLAFDKAIAADPNKAEAYYWKGVNLLSKATFDKDNKMVAPPGTGEVFNKYLELEPNGRYASAAKEILTRLGAKVETSFTKKKK